MNKFLKALSFGLIMSGVALSQENTSKHDVFKANNSLPPTWDGPFKVNNSLPPTPENTLPPTWDLCATVKAQKISSQNAMAMRYMQMQRQHTRV